MEVAQDGDNIHRKLLVLDPRTGATVGELADGPGLGVSAFGWSPVPAIGAVDRPRARGPVAAGPVGSDDRRTDGPRPRPSRGGGADRLVAGRPITPARAPVPRPRPALPPRSGPGSLTEIGHPNGEILGARVRPDGRVVPPVDGSPGAGAARRHGRGGPHSGPRRRPRGEAVPRVAVPEPRRRPRPRWLVTPPGEGPFPLYLKVHGGPNWLYLDTWWPDVQSLVDEGFAVAMVNYRGSIGYGRRGAITSSATSGSPRSRMS